MSTTLSCDRTDVAARPVVVYDGECPFCARQIEKFKRRDTGSKFDYVPRQDKGIETRFPMLADADFNTGMRLVHPDLSVSVGADAVYHIARRLNVWRWFAWLYRVPVLNFVCRAAYAWVARNRYRLAKKCDDGTCPR